MRTLLGALVGLVIGASAGWMIGIWQMGPGPPGSDGDWLGLGIALISPFIGGGVGAIVGAHAARRRHEASPFDE